MSLESIRSLQTKMSALAAENEKAPAVIFSEETAIDDAFAAPWLGEYVHPDWREADYEEFAPVFGTLDFAVFEQDPGIWVFVDKSGWGEPGERALTKDQLAELLGRLARRAAELGNTLGIGITEEGQFQIHLGLYLKKGEG
jgi:hypothetical protein